MCSIITQPWRLFRIAIAVLFGIVVSMLLLGIMAPAMVSSTDSLLVILGFLIPAVWVIVVGCIFVHAVQVHKRSKAQQEQQQ